MPIKKALELHSESRAINEVTNATWNPRAALRICELVADGQTLVDVCKREDTPSRATVYRWLTAFPEFYDAYERAKELSAQSFEDEALGLARTLVGPNDFTGTKIKAYEVAMAQLRWSAARRDKTRYGNVANVSTTVPIQINTTLDLGQGGVVTTSQTNVYEISSLVPPAAEPADTDAPEPVDFAEVVDDNQTAFGVQDVQKHRLGRKRGRPTKEVELIRKGKHKTPAQTKHTATKYRNRMLKKNGGNTANGGVGDTGQDSS